MSKRARWAPSFVTVVATTTVGIVGCNNSNTDVRTHNPPAPPPQTASAEPTPAPDTTVPPTNPPRVLPHFDDVKSSHPEGATNPPSPVLQLLNDGRCFKQWHGGMIAYAKDTKPMEIGGTTYQVRVLDAIDSSMGNATEIQCPQGAEKARADFGKAPKAGAPPKDL
jgi:hypothetical protein